MKPAAIALLFLTLTACGATGPAGPAGATGPAGPAGATGPATGGFTTYITNALVEGDQAPVGTTRSAIASCRSKDQITGGGCNAAPRIGTDWVLYRAKPTISGTGEGSYQCVFTCRSRRNPVNGIHTCAQAALYAFAVCAAQ